MSLHGIGQSPLPLQDAARLTQHPGKELQLGQIIFGKVLRVERDGGYLVDIHGRQQIVDSAIPLKQEEVFRGKVVGLGERVVLEKMVALETQEAVVAQAEPALESIDRNLAQTLQGFVQQHKKVFTVPQWNQLLRAAERSEQPQTLVASAVFLQKLGVNFDPQLIRKLAERIAGDGGVRALSHDQALHLGLAPATTMIAAGIKENLQALGDRLQDVTDQAQEDARALMNQYRSGARPGNAQLDSANDQNQGHDDEALNHALLHWLLNAQQQGAVSHRVVVLPLVFNGQLVELEMSLLDQNAARDTASELQSKLLHFSLETSALGKLGATIHLVNQNLRVRFSAPSEQGLHVLAVYREALSIQLQALGYRVDEVGYDLLPPEGASGVIKPVLDFMVQDDSLSVLV